MIRRVKSYRHWAGFKLLDVRPLQEISYAHGSSYSEGKTSLQRVRLLMAVVLAIKSMGADGGKT